MSSEGKWWTIYLDKRVGEPWWRVRWSDTPREGAEGYEVIEVVPASEIERLRERLNAIHNITRPGYPEENADLIVAEAHSFAALHPDEKEDT